MSKDPAFLFYTQDFIVGTMTMSFEDRGKYIHILCMMHQNGRMNEETIRLLVGSVSDNLKSKFQIDKNGLWYNTRLEEEMEKRKKFAESRRINGLKGGRPKKEKPSAKPSAKPLGYPSGKPSENLIENENIIDNKDRITTKEDTTTNLATREGIAESFDRFWNLYDYKVSEQLCMREWLKLTEQEEQKIFEHVPKYVKATPDKNFRKQPLNYLEKKAWNDEIPLSKEQQAKIYRPPKKITQG